MSNELEPCPFCGGKAVVWNSGNLHVAYTEYRVCCVKCRVSQAPDSHLNEKEAIEAWNKRVK